MTATHKPVQVEVTMGAMSKLLTEQLAPFNLPEKKVNNLQKIADAITRLGIIGYIPDSQTERCRKKLFKEIQKTIDEHSTELAE